MIGQNRVTLLGQVYTAMNTMSVEHYLDSASNAINKGDAKKAENSLQEATICYRNRTNDGLPHSRILEQRISDVTDRLREFVEVAE